MSKKRDLSTEQREKRLIELIGDAKELGFNICLIEGYEKQLMGIQAELREIKEHLKLNKLKKRNNKNDKWWRI